MAEKYRPIIEKKDKENQIKSVENTNYKLNNESLTKLTKPVEAINTKDKLVKIAGIEQYTYYKGKVSHGE